MVPVITYHPFEMAYFSPLIGGLGGAQERRWLFQGPPHDGRTDRTEGDYWETSTSEAIRTLKKVLLPRQTFAYCGPWEPQIRAVWPEAGGRAVPAAKADYVVKTYRGECGDELKPMETRPLVFDVRRGGGIIYQIFGPRPSETPCFTRKAGPHRPPAKNAIDRRSSRVPIKVDEGSANGADARRSVATRPPPEPTLDDLPAENAPAPDPP